VTRERQRGIPDCSCRALTSFALAALVFFSEPLLVSLTARFRETGVYSQDARQIASEQDCRGERSGRGLITDGRLVESARTMQDESK